MKRDIAVAVAVLSVLAGLLTVAYAQNRTEEEPHDIRRWLIDRIEAAYTVGDMDTLRIMRFAALSIDSPEVDLLHPDPPNFNPDNFLHSDVSAMGGGPSGPPPCLGDDVEGPPAPGQERCGEQEKRLAREAEQAAYNLLRMKALAYYRHEFRSLGVPRGGFNHCAGTITAMYQACVLSGPTNRNRTRGLAECTGATVGAQRCLKAVGCRQCNILPAAAPPEPRSDLPR